MAGEKEVVPGRHGESVTHESRGVDGQSTGHGSGDAVLVMLAFTFTSK